MLWILGGWGDRPDHLWSCAERVQRSLRLAPSQPDVYGDWGVWLPRDPDGRTGYDLQPVDVEDIADIERAIDRVTERAGGDGPAAGVYAEFARSPSGERPATGSTRFEYVVRAGFTDRSRAQNQVAFDVDAGTDDRTLMAYMTALVQAWEPDHLGAVTQQTKRAQRYRSPEAVVGRLTYIRAGTPLDTGVLADRIDIAAADGGHYIRVPGTPERPSLDHITTVRRALGYGGSGTRSAAVSGRSA